MSGAAAPLVLAIRPRPGSEATVEAGARMGLAIEPCPLSVIRPLPWAAPPAGDFDGLLLGSANAVRHAGPALAAFAHLPVHAVGGATAQAAREAGLHVAEIGPGMLQSLVDRLGGRNLRLLRLTGAEHVAVHPPAGITVRTLVVYESVALPLPPFVAARLRLGAVVLLHSAAAARQFAGECDRLMVPRGSIALAALGPRIAAAAGEGWLSLRSAEQPEEGALLALARDMCHERRAS